jgi:DNA-binding HxlR family transcriptional regulator
MWHTRPMTTVALTGPLADRDRWSADRCSMAAALTVVGRRSTLLLLREAFYGTRRFEAFARRVGLSEAVTAARLKELVDDGLLERVPYREPGARTRSEYVLTEKGSELFPVLMALMRWGDRWVAEDGGPITAHHVGCGAPVEVELRCAAGHRVGPADVGVAPA